MTSSRGLRIWIGAGPRATEDAVFTALDAALAARPLTDVATPIRVIVPSRSLREHVATTFLRRRGRAVAGLQIQTVFGVAAELVMRVDGAIPRGKTLTRLFARRFAAADPVLAAELGHLEDGPAAVVGSVRDLIEAGVDASAALAIDRALGARGSDAAVARARALVRVALATVNATGEWRGGGSLALLRRATAVLASQRDSLPTHRLLVHGFADATAAATQFLTALAAGFESEVFFDQPADPAGDDGGDGETHPRRLRERFTAIPGALVQPRLVATEITRIEHLCGAGAEDEVNAVLARVLELLDAGVEPESIAIVGRDLSDYTLAIRARCGRLGVPFSGLGTAGPFTPIARAASALSMLLTRAGDLPTDRWLQLLRESKRDGLAAGLAEDLRLAFHTLGAGRLKDVAGLDASRFLDPGDGYSLMVRHGLGSSSRPLAVVRGDDDSGSDESETSRRSRGGHRRVVGLHFRRLIAIARSLLARLGAWPADAEVKNHAGWLRGLMHDSLDLVPDSEIGEAVADAVADLPASLRIAKSEFVSILAATLVDCGRSLAGGVGGGVRLLSVTEARARTFPHLFVIGMNRDLFPRAVREDPLLPDRLRQVIAETLPALVGKRASGFAEERYLFAQLMSASPRVTISWQRTNEDGRLRPSSPFVERLRWGAAASFAPSPTAAPARDARDLAIALALGGERAALGSGLALVIGAHLKARVASRLIAARIAVLDEIDPDRRTRAGHEVATQLGPYLGFVGPIAVNDPRSRDLWVTGAERIVGCGWQHLLESILRLQRVPDPLAALPAIDAMVLGQVVHATLESIVRLAIGYRAPSNLDDALARNPVALAWPPADVVADLLGRHASEVVLESGSGLAGIATLYAELARPMVEAVRDIDWTASGEIQVVGAELDGRFEVAQGTGGKRGLGFRVDRVDRLSSVPRLTDYKTGRPGVAAVDSEKRHEQLIAGVRRGRFLQPAVYAAGAGGHAIGRYLYVAPEVTADSREVAVTAADSEVRAALLETLTDVFTAWDQGSLPPRVVEPDLTREPRRCSYCGVAEACIRGDSGSRGRIEAWVESRRADPKRIDDSERAWLALWDRAAGGPPS